MFSELFRQISGKTLSGNSYTLHYILTFPMFSLSFLPESGPLHFRRKNYSSVALGKFNASSANNQTLNESVNNQNLTAANTNSSFTLLHGSFELSEAVNKT